MSAKVYVLKYGLRTPNEAFFIKIPNLSMFSNYQPLFLQKPKPLYPNPKYLFCDCDLNLNLGRKELET